MSIKSQNESSKKFAGLHLAGSNSNKTALVISQLDPQTQLLSISKVYEKIGSYGSLYSDDRLISILANELSIQEIVTDCPLSVPPCVACILDHCPGVVACENLEVAYMLALGKKIAQNRKKRKVRPINPQSHRLWDIENMLALELPNLEPSYNANVAPLIIRAQVLQKRLNNSLSSLVLKETSIPFLLLRLAPYLGLGEAIAVDYHSFEIGKSTRKKIIEKMSHRWFVPQTFAEDHNQDILASFTNSTPVFVALLCSVMGFLIYKNLIDTNEHRLMETKHLVYLPKKIENKI